MSLQELKAQAYDLISQIEYAQKKLQETNQEIGKLMSESVVSKSDNTEK